MNPSEQSAGLYRIGAVAKLVGIPEATLRVWERRYQVVSPPKSSGGHRLYSELDVLKVTLLKSLTQEGHAISTLSTMDVPQLQKCSMNLGKRTPNNIPISSCQPL